MPFGFTDYLVRLNRSDETIKDYLKTVNMFFDYIDNHYGKKKEVYEIHPRDIKDFLKWKSEGGNVNTTLNKHLAILRVLFDYLWREGKVPLDPTVKIERVKIEDQKPNIITYEMLLDILPKVIQNEEFSILRKAIFILALKGIRSVEYQILKENVIDKDDVVIIKFNKRDITLKGIEAEVFSSHFFDSQFNESKYVFVTNKQDGTIVPVEYMSIHMHLNAITEWYEFPSQITLNSIRHAYVYYLYNKGFVIEKIAKQLGIETHSAANLIKNSDIRYQKGIKTLENRCIR